MCVFIGLSRAKTKEFLTVNCIEFKSFFFPGPAAVSDIVAIGGTTNMSVSWTLALGQVDSYTVLLYRDSQLKTNHTDLSNTTVNTVFQDLKPGVLYCVVVITKSQPFQSNNASVYNATCESPS